MKITRGNASVRFSDEDQEWVATTSDFPSLWWLAATPSEALSGLESLVAEVQEDLVAERDE